MYLQATKGGNGKGKEKVGDRKRKKVKGNTQDRTRFFWGRVKVRNAHENNAGKRVGKGGLTKVARAHET